MENIVDKAKVTRRDTGAAAGAVVLGANQYGKAEVRLVRIERDTPRHTITDLNVTSLLRGDFADCYLSGDNAHVLATDTQKNTIYAFAKERWNTTAEEFLLTLGRHFVSTVPWTAGGRWDAEQFGWERITAGGKAHEHSFVRTGQEVRTAAVTIEDRVEHVVGGLKDLMVLKSTGSEFTGFPRDRYTTLPDTTDRILATSVTARWRYVPAPAGEPAPAVDYDATFAAVKALLLETFARTHSLSLQQSIFAIGERILNELPQLAEIRFAMPNKHHYLADLSPFGLENHNEVFIAGDRPYGLMHTTVTRAGQAEAPAAWEFLGGFC